MTNFTAVLRIVLVCMTAIALIPLNRAAAQDAPAFEAVKSEVPVGKDIRIELKIVGINPAPVSTNVKIEKARLRPISPWLAGGPFRSRRASRAAKSLLRRP
jgi:hypothetical protein